MDSYDKYLFNEVIDKINRIELELEDRQLCPKDRNRLEAQREDLLMQRDNIITANGGVVL